MRLVVWAISARWAILRVAIAGFLLWVLAAETGARLARLQLAAMPGFDFAGEVRALRAQGRFGEAIVVGESGLEAIASGDLGEDAKPGLESELRETRAQQSSWLRKAKDVGIGALTGTGDSLESLIGAVATDLFIVGDVRDLLIQGSKQVIDGDSDEVILALSAIGVVTTLAPEADWVPSVLKAARKTGRLTDKLGETLTGLVRARKSEKLAAVLGDVRTLGERASPGGAMRLLKRAESAEDVADLARFAEKQPMGAMALHLAESAGDDVLALARRGGEARLVAKATTKGRRGLEFLAGRAGRAMLRPHPLVGLAKALWKGNASKLVARAIERSDALAWWMIPALAGWMVVELGLLATKARGRPAAASIEVENRSRAA
ncbi:MAG: hypothetical protein IPK69_09065 [Phycisphaerales bacterium]|nr:MAG: hypothetical protein IPK69_09065 [Phycisphaerales bacterium]